MLETILSDRNRIMQKKEMEATNESLAYWIARLEQEHMLSI